VCQGRDGRQNGEAFVALEDEAEAFEALKKDRVPPRSPRRPLRARRPPARPRPLTAGAPQERIGTRYIEVYKSSKVLPSPRSRKSRARRRRCRAGRRCGAGRGAVGVLNGSNGVGRWNHW
jgi:hypothetical protein